MDARGVVMRAEILALQRLTSLPNNPKSGTTIPNQLVIKGQLFSSQTEAERFFYAMRDKNLVSGGYIEGSPEFDLKAVATSS